MKLGKKQASSLSFSLQLNETVTYVESAPLDDKAYFSAIAIAVVRLVSSLLSSGNYINELVVY